MTLFCLGQTLDMFYRLIVLVANVHSTKSAIRSIVVQNYNKAHQEARGLK